MEEHSNPAACGGGMTRLNGVIPRLSSKLGRLEVIDGATGAENLREPSSARVKSTAMIRAGWIAVTQAGTGQVTGRTICGSEGRMPPLPTRFSASRIEWHLPARLRVAGCL